MPMTTDGEETRRAEGIAQGILEFFKPGPARRTAKKSTGSFETPCYIARFLVRKALEKRLVDFFSTFDSYIRSGDFFTARIVLHEIMTLRILDPAAGKGIFLLECLNILKSFYKKLRNRIRINRPLSRLLAPELETLRRPGLHALRNNLYGVDLSGEALEIAAFTLMEPLLDELEPGDLHVPHLNLKQGNSIISSIMPPDRGKLDSWKTGKLVHLRRALSSARPWQAQWLLQEAEHYARLLGREHNTKLLKYFNSSGTLLEAHEVEEILLDRHLLREELAFTGRRASQISPHQPPAAFNWEVEFPEIFFREDGTLLENPGFDAVVGNPPWGADIDALKGYFEEFWPDFCRGYKDTYKLFMGRILNLTRVGGTIAQVLPNTFQFMPSYRDLREALMSRKILYLANLGEGVFPGVTTPCSAIVLENSPWRSNLLQAADLSRTAGLEKKTKLQQGKDAHWLDQSLYRFTSGNCFLFYVRTTNHDEVPLEEIAVVKDPGIQYHRTGCGLAERGKSDLHRRIFYDGPREHPLDIKVLKGCDLNSFSIDSSRERFMRRNYRELLDPEQGETIIFNRQFFELPEKILWRQTADRPKVAVEIGGAWFMNTLQGAFLRSEYQNVFSYDYLLGLLNSTLMAYFYQRATGEKGRTFPQVRIGRMKSLPIRLAQDGEAFEVEKRVREITVLKNTAGSLASPGREPIHRDMVRQLRESLDSLVFDLYRIPGWERHEIRTYVR